MDGKSNKESDEVMFVGGSG